MHRRWNGFVFLVALLWTPLFASCVVPVAPEAVGVGTALVSQGSTSGSTGPERVGPATATPPTRYQEAAPRMIPLAGPITDPLAEISGMAWYADWLVLMPQFPHRFGEGDGAFFTLRREEVEAYLDGESTAPLEPALLPIEANGVYRLPGYEGYEAIAFDGNRVFVTVEAEPEFGGPMQGWLLSGLIDEGATMLRINAESATALDPQASLSNMTDETLVIQGSGEGAVLHTIYEANGRLVNRRPLVRRFQADLSLLETLPMAPTEFRITDATDLDDANRFWAINYFFPGDLKLRPGGLAEIQLPQIEQLLEFQIDEDRVRRTKNPPYPILLDAAPRNWEGVVRLEGRGFLLVTDRFPTTLLAFIPQPVPQQ